MIFGAEFNYQCLILQLYGWTNSRMAKSGPSFSSIIVKCGEIFLTKRCQAMITAFRLPLWTAICSKSYRFACYGLFQWCCSKEIQKLWYSVATDTARRVCFESKQTLYWYQFGLFGSNFFFLANSVVNFFPVENKDYRKIRTVWIAQCSWPPQRGILEYLSETK